MQTTTITQGQLIGLINILKDTLSSFETKCANVKFLDDWCLYRHLRAFDIPHRFYESKWVRKPDELRKPKFKKVGKLGIWGKLSKSNISARPGKEESPATLGMVLDILEPYIPFRLTEENYDIFMETLLQPENPFLSHKAKLDFIIKLRAITNPAEWEQTILVCETIRSIKEQWAM